MVKDFTLNDVVAFLYNDLGSKDSKDIKNVLLNNKEWNRSFKELREAKCSLPNFKLMPSADVVNRILLYSSINGRAKCN